MTPKQKQNISTQHGNVFRWDAQAVVPDLVVNPYESMGHDRSRHGVLLGKMAGVAVAVKPHENRERANREISNILAFREIGLNALTPIGVFEGREASYLVTEKYEDLTALNGLRLHVAHNERRERQMIKHRAEQGARAGAAMHLKNATHGDFQAKNIFKGPADEDVYGDLENAFIGTQGRGDADRRGADVYMLGASLARGGYLYNRSPSYRMGSISEILIGPYVEATDSRVEARLDLVEAAIGYTIRTNRVVPFGRFVNGVVQVSS